MAEVLQINVVVPPKSVAYLEKLSGLSERAVPLAIQRGLDRGLQIVKQRLVERRLTGSGPFPPDQHRLGQVTGDLAASVSVTPSVIQGNKVVGSIDSDLIYAPVHEYGAVISAKNAPFLVFKVLGRTIRAKTVTIPERAPFRTEIESDESVRVISGEIIQQIEDAASE